MDPLIMMPEQENKTLYYFFGTKRDEKKQHLHEEIRDTLGGIAWVQIKVYGTDRIYDTGYSFPVAGTDWSGQPVTKYQLTRPVKVTSTDEAHVTMALAFSDRLLAVKEDAPGGVMKALKTIEHEVKVKTGERYG